MEIAAKQLKIIDSGLSVHVSEKTLIHIEDHRHGIDKSKTFTLKGGVSGNCNINHDSTATHDDMNNVVN